MNDQYRTEEKKESTIYVQQPDGKEMDVKEKPVAETTAEEGRQTAPTVDTQASSEVTDGEDA